MAAVKRTTNDLLQLPHRLSGNGSAWSPERGVHWGRTSGLCATRCCMVMLELYVVPVSASMPTLEQQPQVTRSS